MYLDMDLYIVSNRDMVEGIPSPQNLLQNLKKNGFRHHFLNTVSKIGAIFTVNGIPHTWIVSDLATSCKKPAQIRICCARHLLFWAPCTVAKEVVFPWNWWMKWFKCIPVSRCDYCINFLINFTSSHLLILKITQASKWIHLREVQVPLTSFNPYTPAKLSIDPRNDGFE